LELTDLQADGFDLELLGFDTKELNALLEPEVVEGLTDEDAVPDVPDEPKTKPGNIYELGNHRLMCGDSCNIEAVEALTGGLVDILVTDPPYNVAYEGKTKDALTIKNDAMGDEQFRQFLRDAFVAANAVMKPGAVFYIWHADSEGYNFRGACHDTGWKVRQCLIWAKDTMVMGRQDYHWKHEPCLYGWKDGAAHLWASDRKQVTIINCKRPTRNAIHPTMKPVELMEYQILNNTKGMDVVLDLFGGSGSTMIACEKLGRKACLMELDPKYCDVIVKRWEDFTGGKAKLLIPQDNTVNV
jgi:site-specific DNA-methyltransferase (adenine-specific)